MHDKCCVANFCRIIFTNKDISDLYNFVIFFYRFAAGFRHIMSFLSGRYCWLFLMVKSNFNAKFRCANIHVQQIIKMILCCCASSSSHNKRGAWAHTRESERENTVEYYLIQNDEQALWLTKRMRTKPMYSQNCPKWKDWTQNMGWNYF